MARRACLLALIALSTAGQAPQTGALQRTSRSVVAVVCGERRSATGFLWRSNRRAITALHVVAGCDDLYVRFESLRLIRRASVARVLREADLAMLDIEDPPPAPGLDAAAAQPGIADELVALGYSLGAPSMGSVNLRLSFGSSVLGDILPRASAQQVESAGMPSLSLRIVRLQGHLLPGLSGAPIVDGAGGVVAVADGGLESGAAAISWAVPVQHVARLEASAERVTQASVRAGQLFAADIEATRGSEITCGRMTLTKLRTADYEELSETADDPASAALLKQFADIVEMDPGDLTFDIYSDLRSGATLAVPEDLQFDETGERGCVYEDSGGGLRIFVSGRTGANSATAAQEFHKLALGRTGLVWTQIPDGFSALARPDSASIGRSIWQGQRGGLLGIGGPPASALEVRLSRGGAFLGVAVLALDARLQDTNMGFLCALNGGLPGCPQLIELMQNWTQMMLGGYLSTFPIT